MKIRDIIKLIESDGWYLVATKGSHRQYKHPKKLAGLLLPENHLMKLLLAQKTVS